MGTGTGMNTETRPVFEICCATLPLSRLTSCRIEVACNFTMLASIGFVGAQLRLETNGGGIHVSMSMVFERIIWSSVEIYTMIETGGVLTFRYNKFGRVRGRGERIEIHRITWKNKCVVNKWRISRNRWKKLISKMLLNMLRYIPNIIGSYSMYNRTYKNFPFNHTSRNLRTNVHNRRAHGKWKKVRYVIKCPDGIQPEM